QDQVPVGTEQVMRLVDPENRDTEILQPTPQRLPHAPAFAVSRNHRVTAAFEQGAAHALEGGRAGHAGFEVMWTRGSRPSNGGMSFQAAADEGGLSTTGPIDHQHAPGLAARRKTL